MSTPNALCFAEAENIDLLALLARHHQGDWGDVCEEDRESNEEALLMHCSRNTARSARKDSF